MQFFSLGNGGRGVNESDQRGIKRKYVDKMNWDRNTSVKWQIVDFVIDYIYLSRKPSNANNSAVIC